MRPFWGTDQTFDKKNMKLNGQEFLMEEPSPEMRSAWERASDAAVDTVRRSMLPRPLRIMQYIFGMAGAICFAIAVKSITGRDSVALSDLYRTFPWLFWVGGGCLILWATLLALGSKKRRDVFDEESSGRAFASVESVEKAVFEEMGVPADAETAEILSFSYKMKDGKPCAVTSGSLEDYVNLAFKVFADSEYFYLADVDGKYAFPLSSLVAIHKVDKHIRLTSWDKEERMNSERYKEYKLWVDKYGSLHCRRYYILEVEHESGAFGIYFPCYELPVFEHLTGLYAES